jgi:hypothetical protein
MLFSVHTDVGSQICGYLVPDSFSGEPAVRITDGQRELLVFPCKDENPALVQSGRHATGRCGFTIDDTVVSGLSAHERLEIYDVETNFRIYRRRRASEVVEKRIFRLETHLFPLWHLDDVAGDRFQHFHKGIDRYGRETATQVFVLLNGSSLYFSGRLVVKAYENFIDETFSCIALLHDPYWELAERLLTLKHIRQFGDELLGKRDMMAYGPAIRFADTIQNDEKALRRAFASMPNPAVAIFANPVTRQLAARAPEEQPGKGAVALALNTLSTFTVVGVREHQNLFLGQLAHLLGTDVGSLPAIPEFDATSSLAERLKQVPEVEILLEQDLEVYHHVKAAINEALSDREMAEAS